MITSNAVTVTPASFEVIHGRKEKRRPMPVAEVAELLGLAPRTVRRYIADGTFPGFKVGRKYYVSPDALDAFMNGGVGA